MKKEKTFTYKFWINHIQFKQDTNHTHLRQEMWKQNKKRKQKLPISLFLTLREMTSYISDWRNRVTRRPPSQKTKQPRPRKSTRARAPYPRYSHRRRRRVREMSSGPPADQHHHHHHHDYDRASEPSYDAQSGKADDGRHDDAFEVEKKAKSGVDKKVKAAQLAHTRPQIYPWMTKLHVSHGKKKKKKEKSFLLSFAPPCVFLSVSSPSSIHCYFSPSFIDLIRK